ncbi:MAG: PhzF family phenazine biosynthesis isomerase [Ruminococcus sp.]|uniref:PhzF family phenazine biosynthesis protein n=1 Tax=Ruminococcus sp. TaxID=41978 RepID=UPI0025F136E6|nr:PhzF family phenazine biosynthesis isomerase [Ruminococcus sp.]MBR5683452.1 PhzF family phenazine biosynthesis isomerase [Ruminococcus sp.]
MKQYIVDAFTDKLFSGNPAAVCVSDSFPGDKLMQSIAAENNLSETAFLVKEDSGYRLRWFAPKGEVDFCGHATLGAAFVLFSFYEQNSDSIVFETAKGRFAVKRRGDLIEMDFPAYRPEHYEITDEMINALGAIPLAAYRDRDIMFVFRDEDEIRHMNPDLEQLSRLECACVAVTAKGREYDCVSRVFAPRYGIPEDPVTGSAHCMIAPYWSKRLNKETITAYQASERTGSLQCEICGDRVKISGRAVLFSVSDIIVHK